MQELAAAARAALGALHAGDRVAVMLFAREAAVRERFTADFAERAERDPAGRAERGLGSGTAINAAIIKAAQYIAERRPGRRAARS